MRNVVGVGVQATIFVVRLSGAGHEVMLIARGSRPAELERRGAITENIRSRRIDASVCV